MDGRAGPHTSQEGHYAGIVTCFVGFAIDLVAIAVIFTIGGRGRWSTWSASCVGHPMRVQGRPGLTSNIALVSGRSSTSPIRSRSPAGRSGWGSSGSASCASTAANWARGAAPWCAFCLPLSFLLFGFGFVLIVLRGDRRALHDLIGGSAVVYAWDARAARLRFLARH